MLWHLLWKPLHLIYEKVPSLESKKSLADHIVCFLSNKIFKIHETFSNANYFEHTGTSEPPGLSAFKYISDEEIYKIIAKSHTKSCLLNPLPTFLVKNVKIFFFYQ